MHCVIRPLTVHQDHELFTFCSDQLLADFTVSMNTTRVVVITYSSVDRVIRQIDHISRPNPHLHKCHLLQESLSSSV
jgi:hypothetical protein